MSAEELGVGGIVQAVDRDVFVRLTNKTLST